MKDKLEKHHLPKRHFLHKKIFIIFLIAVGISCTFAVPLGVNAYVQSQVAQTHRK